MYLYGELNRIDAVYKINERGKLQMEQQLVLVDKKVLPEVFEKVLMAKTYLSKDMAKNSTEACRMAELSRSAFYKYKDSVFFYEDKDKRRVITYSLRLSDEPGVLSNLLTKLSSFHANILTVNQNIPVDRVAVVTISFRIDERSTDMDRLQEEISHIGGVIRAKQI